MRACFSIVFQYFFNKGVKIVQWGKNIFFNKWIEVFFLYKKEWNYYLCFTSYTKLKVLKIMTITNTWHQLIQRKVCCGSQFLRFQYMVGWPHCFGSCGDMSWWKHLAEQNYFEVSQSSSRACPHPPQWHSDLPQDPTS
jgi:hypothetical protein